MGRKSHSVRTGRRYRPGRLAGPYDALVVGSGIGGLTAAACLAKMGRKVCVLEQHYTAGGFTHAYEREGYDWDVGVHYIGDMGSPRTMGRRLFDYITDGALQWAPAPAARLTLQAEHLMPSPWVPDWPPEARLNAGLLLELSHSQLRLGRLDLWIPETDSRLAVDGQAKLTPELEPATIQARLDWSGLHWPPVALAPQLASPEGRLTLEGTPDAYRFDLEGTFTGSDVPGTHDPHKAGFIDAGHIFPGEIGIEFRFGGMQNVPVLDQFDRHRLFPSLR